jgi:periplasmic divalent cation tolerance protein
MNEACVVLTTTDSEEEAGRIARGLVEARLAACVQRLPIGSVYSWQGAVEETGEILLLVKTTVGRYAELEAWIAANHSYEVPEIVMLRADRAAAGYLAWLTGATGAGRGTPETG